MKGKLKKLNEKRELKTPSIPWAQEVGKQTVERMLTTRLWASSRPIEACMTKWH